MHKYLAYRSSNGGAHYHTKYITKITHEDAAKYGSFRVTGAEPHYLYLQLGEKMGVIIAVLANGSGFYVT